MIHGKWYKGTDDLSVLKRNITEADKLSWHLVIDRDGALNTCSLSPFEDGFCISELKASDAGILELMLRMIAAKLDSFNMSAVYAKEDTGISGFGFKSYKMGILKTDKIILPVHCKG